MLNAATQTFLGDRSADLVAGYDANLLGTAGSVAFGLSGLDFYKDLSDIAYGLENWENTPGDYLNLGANLIALIPVIGAFKNLGKPATDAASNVAKRIDDEVANLRAIGANNRSAPDFHNNISQRQPGGYLPAPARVSKNFKVEPVELLGGRKGRDFVLYGDDGLERFTARLMDGEKTLSIGWTDNVPRTAARLREAQQLAGGPGSFNRITGLASDQLEAAIRNGTFDANRAAELLNRSLGGNWRVTVTPRAGQPGVFDVIGELIQ